MALYTRESKERVRDAVDFVELVSARTELRRNGPANYVGLCPFHDERSPSFGIDPGQKVYYCFGCQAAGDVFTFVQEVEGVDFKDALELLADRYGVELEREQEDPREAEQRKTRERLLQLLSRTAEYYERYLWESTEAAKARDYLRERGLEEEILREFRVGYAPSAWDRVLLASRRGGFSEQELYATGLAQRSRENGQFYDRFRARIMFPLADIKGSILGFGARAMHDEQKPKYLNTSDNDVYHKGSHVYGAKLARPSAAKAHSVVLCEGYTDVIAMHQAGMKNCVGLMGTALTPAQVRELSRMANTVLLALDADTAGQAAMLKAYTLASERELALRVVPLPVGADPADLLLAGGSKAVQEAIGRSVEFARFRVERVLASGDTSDTEVQDSMLDELREIFSTLPSRSTVRDELTRLVSSRFARPNDLVEKRLAEPAKRSPSIPAAGQTRAKTRVDLSRLDKTEREFLALCIAAPEGGLTALRGLHVEEHFSSSLMRRAARYLMDNGLPVSMSAPGLDDDLDLHALLAELIVQAGSEEPRSEMLDVQRLQLELARVDRQIQRARGEESGEVSELAKRRGEVKREFDKANERVLEETGGRKY
ncbi:MAG TPA: DNA primase [Solirubrobacteraceae bacterium]|jgi:DNA primase|nr:DNA primase [Solirubrobacteraceae bacterium]